MKAVFSLFVIIAILEIATTDVHHYRIDSNGNRVEVPLRNSTNHQGGQTSNVHPMNNAHPTNNADPTNNVHPKDNVHPTNNAHRFIVDKNGNKIPIDTKEVYETVPTVSTPHSRKGLLGLVGGVVKGVGGVVDDLGGVVQDVGTAL